MTFDEPLLIDEDEAELAPAPYAGMWRRLGGALVDFIIVGYGLVALANVFFGKDAAGPVFLLYFTFSYAGPLHATLGQRLFGLHVTTKDGTPLSTWHASLRTCALLPCFFLPAYMTGMFLSTLVIALIWYAPAWFTREKTAIHDMLSGTRVRVGCV